MIGGVFKHLRMKSAGALAAGLFAAFLFLPPLTRAHEGGTVWLIIRSSVVQGGNSLEKVPFPTVEQCEEAGILIESNDAFAGKGRKFGTQCLDARLQNEI